MRVCKEKGCENKHNTKGWCGKHYMRWKRHGDPKYISRKIHGYSNHPLYKVWTNMKQRCYNENNKQYKDYGGREIAVCAEWKDSFISFKKWTLPLWKKGLLIDRIDNEGNYKPSNCHFVTRAESNLNQRLLRSDSTSGFRGISYNKNNKKWIAEIMTDSKKKYLGSFNSAKEAALAFDKAIIDNRPKNFE